MRNFEVNTDHFAASVRRLSALNGKTMAELLLSYAKTTMINRHGVGILDLTPPGGGGTHGHAAKKRGEKTIARDLARIFVGVPIKDKLRERHPDIAAIHRRHLIRKRPGSPMRCDRGKQKYYVDAAHLRSLAKTLRGRVGRLASGWVVSLRRLGMRGPAWVERHGAGPGEVRIDVHGAKKIVEMTLFARDHAPVADMNRRVSAALFYTSQRVKRAIIGTIAANARGAGFKLAA